MPKRVLRHHLWVYAEGDRLSGDLIITEHLSFKKDTMITDEDTLLLKWQYFSSMKVQDPKTGKTGIYEMKGANWTNYLFK